MRLKLVFVFAFVWSGIGILPLPSLAAPQILALVATTTPLPLSCVGGVCRVEVSGVCLQEQRPAPNTGTAYRVATGSKLTLVVQGRDGKTQTMAVEKLVEIRSLRLFNSLSISLPERVVQNLTDGVALASLSVAPLTSLLPMAEAGDPNPLTEREIHEYTVRLRARAESAFEIDKANLAATRVLNQMVNRLSADIHRGAEGTEKLGQTMSKKFIANRPAAMQLVTRALNTCREKLRVERTPHLRACLSNQHDILNSNTTLNVWQSLRPSG